MPIYIYIFSSIFMPLISIISSLLLKKPHISSLCLFVIYFSQKCLLIVCLNPVLHKVYRIHLFNNFLSFIFWVSLYLPFCHLFKKLHHLSCRISYNLTLAICSLVMQFNKFLCFTCLSSLFPINWSWDIESW